MARQGINQRFIRTKVKHRRKLNERYNPRQWLRCTFVETESTAVTDFLQAWAKHLLELCDA